MANKLRIAALCAVLTATLCLSSCAGIFTDPKELMRPPMAAGELKGIEQALTDAIGEEYSFVYPNSGSYRTACILQDIMGDEAEEALVFYSSGETTQIHVNLLQKQAEQWYSYCDTQITGTGIDRVDFADLCGGAEREILIGSNLYNTKEKQLSVYSPSERSLELKTQENYTEMTVCDIIGDERPQLLLCSLGTQAANTESDSAESVITNFAVARLISLAEGTDGATTLLGTAALDQSITAFSALTVGPLSNGNNAVYIDAYKGADTMITELLYYNNALINAFYIESLGETQLTRRSMTVNSRDIDGDGAIEIPEGILMPGIELMQDAEAAYYSVWKRYGADGLETATTGVLNTVDSYYLEAQPGWIGTTTVRRDYSAHLRIFYEWNLDTDSIGPELFRLRVFSDDEWNSDDARGYQQITAANDRVYAAYIDDPSNDAAPDMAYLKAHFRLL